MWSVFFLVTAVSLKIVANAFDTKRCVCQIINVAFKFSNNSLTYRVLRREQEERRLAIAPFLQAESDITCDQHHISPTLKNSFLYVVSFYRTVESMQRMIDEQSYIMREVTDFNPTVRFSIVFFFFQFCFH
jgi:hypothetical protein